MKSEKHTKLIITLHTNRSISAMLILLHIMMKDSKLTVMIELAKCVKCMLKARV